MSVRLKFFRKTGFSWLPFNMDIYNIFVKIPLTNEQLSEIIFLPPVCR